MYTLMKINRLPLIGMLATALASGGLVGFIAGYSYSPPDVTLTMVQESDTKMLEEALAAMDDPKTEFTCITHQNVSDITMPCRVWDNRHMEIIRRWTK